MEIILLKNHNRSKAGSKHDVAPEAASYLVRCKVAEYAEKPKLDVNLIPVYTAKVAKPNATKKSKQVKPKLEKK